MRWVTLRRPRLNKTRYQISTSRAKQVHLDFESFTDFFRVGQLKLESNLAWQSMTVSCRWPKWWRTPRTQIYEAHRIPTENRWTHIRKTWHDVLSETDNKYALFTPPHPGAPQSKKFYTYNTNIQSGLPSSTVLIGRLTIAKRHPLFHIQEKIGWNWDPLSGICCLLRVFLVFYTICCKNDDRDVRYLYVCVDNTAGWRWMERLCHDGQWLRSRGVYQSQRITVSS